MRDWAAVADDIRANRFWICFYEPDSPLVRTEVDNDGNAKNAVDICGGPLDSECRWRKLWSENPGKAEELCCTHHKIDVGCGWYLVEKTT